MTTVPQLAQTLQTVFTTTADAAARATGFVQRRSKLTGAAFVQALVFGWPGCGGSSATHTQAALKLGVRWDLCRGVLRGPWLYDGRTHESTTPIQSAPLPAGALRLADLGFFDLETLAQIGAQDGYWLSRLHFGTAVYDAQGRRWDVLDLLAAQGMTEVDLPIALGAQHRLPAG